MFSVFVLFLLVLPSPFLVFLNMHSKAVGNPVDSKAVGNPVDSKAVGIPVDSTAVGIPVDFQACLALVITFCHGLADTPYWSWCPGYNMRYTSHRWASEH